jgi:D-amino-acid dehydrogenase
LPQASACGLRIYLIDFWGLPVPHIAEIYEIAPNQNKSMKVVIIGGGIIGLSSAYYLHESGHDVTVIDKTDMTRNCSYGNAGYVCPSHFIPLATPGIVKQGLKWMWNSKSPFYVQPRLSWSLIDWGLKFMRSATPEKVESAAVPLRDIAILSQKLYEDWTKTSPVQICIRTQRIA